MPISNITLLPTPVPSRTDPTNFASRADAFLGALPTFGTQLNTFATEANALAVDVQENKDSTDQTLLDMQALGVDMTSIYNSSVATSNFKGLWSSLTGALNKPASVYRNSNYWVLLNNLTDVTTSTPSDANADWLKSSNTALGITYDASNTNLGVSNVQSGIDALYSKSSHFYGLNLIVNPNFRIQQDFISTAITGTPTYLADQWLFSAGGNPPSLSIIPNSVSLQGPLGGNISTTITQRLEPAATQYLFYNTGTGNQIQLSFRASMTIAGSLSWALKTPNTTGEFPAPNVFASGSVTLSNMSTDYYVTVDVPVDESFFNGLQLDLTVPALNGLTSKFTLKYVQLTRTSNNAKIPFIPRPYQQELALCQRYWQKLDVTVTTGPLFQSMPLPVEMRVTPTVTGGGSGFTLNTNNNNKVLNCYQTTRAGQTLVLNARL